MREMARRPESDRRDLFRSTGQNMQIHEAIAEKDFWVCWVLDYLFQDSPWRDQLAFKGGTSLSKAYGAIERFSEDIDLIVDWRLLGYSEEEPWARRSVSKQEAFGKESNSRAKEFLATVFAPTLARELEDRAAAGIEVMADGQDVLIRYPRAFSLATIQPQIRLEIGPLAAWAPNEERQICSYAAEQFPQFFLQGQTSVRTIAAERTFWEKATILHQEAHRGEDKPLPPRYSRHYYDLYRLSRMPIRDNAIRQIALLHDVAQFKIRFYHCPWAKYEEAKPGTLRLLPPEHHMRDLRRDYVDMQAMLFGVKPSFEEIMSELADLEDIINKQHLD